ncbi:MAG: flagellar hook-length control protein FliK [Candidatus Kapabacteria bacterium]|nr:flagellar hook-length control protein FliK [Candidatus Kapabacteria bacterium]
MIAFNVGIPEQLVVLGDSKIYASSDLLGSDFSAEFASALATTELKADSDKSGNSLVVVEGNIAIAELASIPEKSELSDVNISPEGQISSPISIGIALIDGEHTTTDHVDSNFILENNDSEIKIAQVNKQISVQISDSISPNLGKIANLNVPETITANPLSEVTEDIKFEESNINTIDDNSPKIASKLDPNSSSVLAEQPLAINPHAVTIDNPENHNPSKEIKANESAKNPVIELGNGLVNDIKSAHIPQDFKISPEIKSSHKVKLNSTESIENKTIQSDSEIKPPTTEAESEKKVIESISQILVQINKNQTTQLASAIVTKNLVDIPQLNDDVNLKITLDQIINNLAKSNQVAPKIEQNNQAQQNLEHLTLLSKGIFDKNLDFVPQKSNKTQNVNEATINISQNSEAVIINSNQAKNDQQIGLLHKIVQNPEQIAINIDSQSTESDKNSPNENKSNSQSNEKNTTTKEHDFVRQAKSESGKADVLKETNDNKDSSVQLPKQSDNAEISELYNKISPFAQKSNNMLVKNQTLTDLETPTKEFAGVKLSDIPRRIMQLATTQASDGIASAKLVMHPKSLGTIVVHLEIVKNVVKLHLTGEKREALSAVESSIGMLKERLQSKGLELDNVEYNLNDSNEQANSSKHNQTEKEQKQIKRTYNNEKLSESSEGNDKFNENKNLRHDNGTIIEKYI